MSCAAPRQQAAREPCGDTCGACKAAAKPPMRPRVRAARADWSADFSRVPTRSGDKNGGAGAAAPVAPATQAPEATLLSLTFILDGDLHEVVNGRKTLRSNSRGGAVKKLQSALLSEGYELRGGSDGVFGNATAAAVVAFQKRWGLAPDGVVGKETIALLDAHLVGKGIVAAGEDTPLIGGAIKRTGAAILDKAESDHRVGTCPAANKSGRRTACIQPIAIAEDDGTAPTTLPSFTLAQRIWEKCCITLSVLGAKTVNKSAFKTLDESPTNTPTAEETALFTAAGSSSCIQVFVPATFAQGGTTGKQISGGGGTYEGGLANPKIVIVEGAVPAVVAHEIGHALGHGGHDAADTVMKPTGAHNVANSSKVSEPVCAAAKTGAAVSATSGSADCCMTPS